VNAATAPEWLTAAAIGTSTLPLLAATAYAANRDLHLPHVGMAPAVAAAGQAIQRARIQLAAWLLLLSWHLQLEEATR
jgi:hypothetical protein